MYQIKQNHMTISIITRSNKSSKEMMNYEVLLIIFEEEDEENTSGYVTRGKTISLISAYIK